VRAAALHDSPRFKVNHDGFIFWPRCIINGPDPAEAFFDRAEFVLLAWCLFSLFPASSVTRQKIELVSSELMKLGAQRVNLRPGPDDQQSTKKKFMGILIFYIFSRLVDLLTGRQTFFARA